MRIIQTMKENISKDMLSELINGKNFEGKIAKLSYEEALALVEELLRGVEMGDLPLEQAIASYEKGMLLVNHLRHLLAGAEARLKMLKEQEGEISIADVE